MECPNCNQEAQEDDKFCRGCGNEVNSTFHCDCGAEVNQEDNFCHQCGTGFEGVEEEGDDASEVEQPAQQPLQQPAQNFNTF